MNPENTIRQFNTPDTRWELWGCKTHEDFLQQFLVKGKFHKDVSEDIIKEYTTVEHLVAHSFYYYPMFDEAFSKTTRIFEMAVKISCNQLGVKPSGKGHIPLYAYISKLKEHYGDLSGDWERERELRNLFAHPEKHFFMGPINRFYAFQHFINIINKLFISKDKLEEVSKNTKALTRKFKDFNKGIFHFDFDDNRYVVESAIPHKCIYKDGKSLSFWEFSPILVKFPQTIDEYSVIKPFYKILLNVELKDGILYGLDVESNKHVMVCKSSNPLDAIVTERYYKMYASSEETVKSFYEGDKSNFIAQQLSLFEYEYCWD